MLGRINFATRVKSGSASPGTMDAVAVAERLDCSRATVETYLSPGRNAGPRRKSLQTGGEAKIKRFVRFEVG